MPKVNWEVAATAELERQIDKDTNDQPRTEYKLLPKGYYVGTLLDVEARQSKNGDPQLKLAFEVVEDQNRQVIARFPTFSLAGYEYAVRDIVNTGVDPATLPDFEVDENTGQVFVDVTAIAAAIYSQTRDTEYRVGVSVDEYEGKDRNGIYWFQAQGERTPATNDAPSGKRKFGF